MNITRRYDEAIQMAVGECMHQRKEFLTPEALLFHILEQNEAEKLCSYFGADTSDMRNELQLKDNNVDTVPEEVEYEMGTSEQLQQVLRESEKMAAYAGKEAVDIPHVLHAMLNLEESWARFVLEKHLTDDQGELLSAIDEAYENEESANEEEEEDSTMPSNASWTKMVHFITSADHNPLIGREPELERTIQVLCRKEKNNPLHVGEPGVGKTALVYGLALRIEQGDVPERLKGATIVQIDMGTMLAGTSYRGDFEKRIKAVMEGICTLQHPIVYIDDIHTLVGTGSIGESSLDITNLLKPYFESGKVRFIGSTTFDEYNRHFLKNKGLVRSFQQIDINEPSVDEAIRILEGLKPNYEAFHCVTFADDVIRYAVQAAASHIHERFLPDKAIDLIDEAGAYRQLHPQLRRYKGELRPAKKQVVDKELVNDVLARICKIDPRSLRDDDTQNLESLNERIAGQIYGQDEAVRQVVEAVQMGKAGLLDEGKPVASLLFVGPTGVGKTEVCKVLAQELGIELVRFDMSEYTEKHTVAKLIGSPAGYVGYEDGGLLTDAIRKTPNCVLLLDEIEKAHSDIYNILLQVMDYARLSDNKGQKADFRHVILVMTSNAGAQYAHQASIGFGTTVSAGAAMLQTVKKTFKPEFLARLSGTVVFNDMDRTMACLILDKKLRQLSVRLVTRKVSLDLSAAAHDFLLAKGFTPALGAREMDRQINQLLSPVLMREILFGSLKKGGIAHIDVLDNKLIIKK